MPRYVKISLAVLAFALITSVSAFAQESKAEMEAPVSRAQAQKIAVDSVVGGRAIESDFNNRWFRDDDYSFVVVNNTDRFDIRVDAVTGKIIKTSHEPIFRDNLTADHRDPALAPVTGTAAAAAAAGATAVDRIAAGADRAVNATRAAADSAVNSARDAADRAAATANRAANTARVAETRAEAAVDRAATSARLGADRVLTPGRAPVAAAITPERARTIASDRAPNASIVDMTRNMDGDKAVYDVEMMGGNKQINMKIDGMDGKVISFDEKQLDAKDRVNQNVNMNQVDRARNSAVTANQEL